MVILLVIEKITKFRREFGFPTFYIWSRKNLFWATLEKDAPQGL
jgi:hypothetical protein